MHMLLAWEYMDSRGCVGDVDSIGGYKLAPMG